MELPRRGPDISQGIPPQKDGNQPAAEALKKIQL
jgi:hypothetical protein